MLDLNKIASDLMLFSMPEIGYFELPDELCTGSSIMPQKKNPDILELVRAKSHIVQSLHFQVVSLLQNLPSGYNRDFQLTKKPMMEGFEITKISLSVMTDAFKSIKVNKEKCSQAMAPDVFAADIAHEHVMKGMPFRDAYKETALELGSLKIVDSSKFIYKTHMGAAGNLGLKELELDISNMKKELNGKMDNFSAKIESLLST